jgi:hypothetical protein
MTPYKILFLTSDGEDYMKDTMYHGLKNLFGTNVSCNTDLSYMYTSHFNYNKLYGRGFTMFCNLDPSLQKVESYHRIIDNIEKNVYDYIIYGSIYRCDIHIDLVRQYYSKDKIIVIDGEDHPYLNNNYLDLQYFKRELINKPTSNLHPVWFGIPKEKLNTNPTEKIKDFATVIPGKLDTYIFTNEKDYYLDYQQSYFGVTTKKAGWDCLRHYEILANDCIPYFPDLDQCPPYTMYKFPKELIMRANKELVETFDIDEYNKYNSTLKQYTKDYLTTEAVVKYILETVNKK